MRQENYEMSSPFKTPMPMRKPPRLHSPWSRTARSPAGWPSSWRCWACWGTSLTLWTWQTLLIGCGGNTRTRRSPRWWRCPGSWSAWPPTSSWSGDAKRETGVEEELFPVRNVHVLIYSNYTYDLKRYWKDIWNILCCHWKSSACTGSTQRPFCLAYN